jgi:hypothetical protein
MWCHDGMVLPAAWKRVLLIAAGTAGTAAVVAVLIALFGPIADRSTPHDKDRAAAVNATRQILLATAAGVAALIGLGFTARTYYLSRRGQLTDRYTKAISQIASPDKLTERLGGIFALEDLMRESSRDHETIVDVLAAFIRESAPIKPSADGCTPADTPAQGPATDVQTALTVLGRRPARTEANRLDLNRTDLRDADLAGAQLKRADLAEAQLQDANLEKAQLQDANLFEAQLQSANLFEAQLQDAKLFGAQLQDADLSRAQLRGADLSGAQLRGADLSGAQLQGTILDGAQLQGAVGITSEQLKAAIPTSSTMVPPHLRSSGPGL